jgi:ribonuclease P protein component
MAFWCACVHAVAVRLSALVVPRVASASGSERWGGIVGGEYCFRPEQRLHRPAEFAAVVVSPHRVRSKHFEMRYRLNQGPSARLGLVMAKRFARHAVLRNLLKRLVRESFRSAQRELPAVDVVVRLTRGLVPSDRHRVELRDAWRGELDKLLTGLAK